MIILDPIYWKERYLIIIKDREILWNEIDSDEFKDEWFISRVSKHQWSMDEILRHMIASEIVYIQQPLNTEIKQYAKAVLAQWVGRVFFRLQETVHVEMIELKEEFKKMEEVSIDLLDELTLEDLNRKKKAPWGKKVKYQQLLSHSIEHEIAHMAQVNFILTYYRGPPKFEQSWGSTKLEDIEI